MAPTPRTPRGTWAARVLVAPAAVLVLGCPRASSAELQPRPAPATGVADMERFEAGADDRAWLARRAAERLAEALSHVGLSPSVAVSGPAASVSVGERTLGVEVEIEDARVHEGSYVLALRFLVSIDGELVEAFASGAVGVGEHAEQARETALLEWVGQYGAPIAFAFAAREFPEQVRDRPASEEQGMAAFFFRTTVEGARVYHGPVGLRGAARDVEAVTSNRFVLELARLVVASAGIREGRYRTVTVQMVVDGASAAEGECRVDGIEVAALCDELRHIAWPEAAPSYMYQQFFVILAPSRPAATSASP